jgi:hypothetical protein
MPLPEGGSGHGWAPADQTLPSQRWSSVPGSGVTRKEQPRRSRGRRLASLRSPLWPWVGRSVRLFGALPNRTQTMTLFHRGASELNQPMEGAGTGAAGCKRWPVRSRELLDDLST